MTGVNAKEKCVVLTDPVLQQHTPLQHTTDEITATINSANASISMTVFTAITWFNLPNTPAKCHGNMVEDIQ